MIVFKTCNLIIKRHIGSLLLYFGIFLMLSVVMSALWSEQYGTDFFEMRPNFTVVNRDGDTALSNGLFTYLNTRGTQVALEDRNDALQDAAFYHATDFIAIVQHCSRIGQHG